MKIRLEPVTVASRAAVERLETAPGQEGFVESVAECLAEADRRRCWRPVGVYDGDALIGFAMYGFFWEYLPFGRLWLDRLLIDRRFQGRGPCWSGWSGSTTKSGSTSAWWRPTGRLRRCTSPSASALPASGTPTANG